MALGSLIIKEKMGLTDRETVESIQENPYLQYFIGLSEYQEEAPFDASMLVHFRQRLSPDIINRVNERVIERSREITEEASSQAQGEAGELNTEKNQGKLILDATCAPADITYPTDLKILNQAREKTEEIIDILHQDNPHPSKKNQEPTED